MKGIKKYIANEHPKYFAKGGIVDPENPDSYLTMSVDDPLLFDGLTEQQKLAVFGNYAPTLDADDARLQSLQNNFLKNYKGTPQYYVPKQGFVAKKDYDIYASSIAKPKATPTEVKSAVASSVFKPKYPAVNTPEWDENQVRIKEEQERRKNEKVQYKATGGVVDSTLEEDAVYRGGKSKKQSTKGSDVAKDIALGTIDLGISTFAPDLIKEKDYSSRYGAHINKTTHGVSQVANSVAEGILHAIFPATAALSPAKKQLGTAISGGKDEAISEKQLKQEGAIAQVGNMGGSFIGSAIGGKNKKETDDTTKTPSAVTQVATAPVARTYQKQDATTYNPDTFDINSLDDADKQGYLNIEGNEAKVNYLRSIGYYSKGGEIVGKGTGTSDSINGTLDGQGFVVPAENADKAIVLRAKYFGNAGKKATLKGGDEKVKVSDGEHYFTPEERAILEANGEDLDALAPDANGGQKSYKCGGGVKKLVNGGGVNGKKTVDIVTDKPPKRKNSTGIGSADKIIDDLYAGKYKTKKEINDAKERLKALTGVGKWSLGNGDKEESKNAFMYADKLYKTKENEEKIKENEAKFDKKIAEQRAELQTAKYSKESIAEFDKTIAEIKKKNYGSNSDPGEYFNTIKQTTEKFEQLKKRRSVENEEIGKGVLKERANNLIKDVDAKVQSKRLAYENIRDNAENYTPSQIEKAKKDFEDEYDFRESLKSFQNVNKGYVDIESRYKDRYNVKDKTETQKPTEKPTDKPKKSSVAEEAKKAPSPYAPPSVTNTKTNVPVKTDGQTKVNTGTGSGTGTGKKGVVANSIANINTTPHESTDAEIEQQKTDLANAVSKKEGVVKTAIAQTEAEKKLEKDALAATNPTTTTIEKKKGILGNIDAEKAIALGQTSLGIQQLLQDGPRPVDSIDSDFMASVNEAKKDANFGLSPLERSIADQNIERSRRGGIRQIIALAGGNSGAAMSNIAAVNIANADNINNLAQTSERLMMDKKRYRDNLIGMKAGMARQLFQDKLNAFEQDQMAGANLVQSGIRNYIGSLRYDKQVQADAELEANRKKSTQVITG